MTATKLDNFKVVAGVMNNTKLSEEEERILQELRAGELLETDKSRGDESIMIGNDDQEDTEDDIEEITVIDEVTEAVEEDIPPALWASLGVDLDKTPGGYFLDKTSKID